MSLPLKTIIKYSPVFVFHEQEKYFPCSIEHILNGATLHKKETEGESFSEVKNPTQEDLVNTKSPNSFIDINPSQYSGMELGSAPLYYSVQKFDSFVEIHYLMLFAFRGSHSFTVETKSNNDVNFVGHNYGQHQGGMSRVTVRLVLIDDMADKYKIFQIGFENDRHMFFDTKDNVNLIEDPISSASSHPLVHVGLFGHNCWNRVIRTPVIVKDSGANTFAISCLGEESPVWKPYEGGENTFKQIGFQKVMNDYRVIEPEIWAQFKGKIGKDNENTWTGAPTDLDGNPLNNSVLAEIDFMKDPDVAFDAYKTDLKDKLAFGKSPQGLGDRYFVYPDKDASQLP